MTKLSDRVRVRRGEPTVPSARSSADLHARRLVIFFLLSSVTPLALLAGVSLRQGSDAVRREVEARLGTTVAASRVAVRNEIEGLADLVTSYAASPSLVFAIGRGGAYDRSTIASLLEDLKGSRAGIATAFLADADGVLIHVVPATPSVVGDDFSHRDWYRGVTSTGATYVSEAYESVTTDHPRVVGVATPVRDPSDGRTVAILVAAYGLDSIQGFVDRLARSQGVTLTVTDQRGVLVAQPGAAEVGLLSRRRDPVVAAALRGDSGVTEREIGEDPSLVAYGPIRSLGWTVTTSVPLSDALAGVGALRSAVLTLSAVIGLALIGGLVLLHRTLVGRRRAEEAAERNRTDALRAHAEADRANHAKSEFLSRMSHELRTPLNAVLGFAQLLEMEPLDEGQRESVGQILKGGRHLLALINEVLDLARIESGRLALSLEPVEVSEVVQSAVDLVSPLAATHAITVSVPTDSEELFVLADRQRLLQIVLNLLSNAVKYNSAGGTATVRWASGDAAVRIEVTDTGGGIPADRMQDLFHPFSRLGAEASGVEGTGLGLALCRRLAEAMGGSVAAESTVGVGSTFRVELPVADRRPGQIEIPTEGNGGVIGSGLEARSVLYIEDNPENLRLMERLLALRPSIRLLAATEGRAGIELAIRHQPDLVLLDLNLPDLPGHEVLERLRARPDTGSIPVVVISADATEGQIATLLRAGARAYLTKPLELHGVLGAVDDILEGGDGRWTNDARSPQAAS